MTVFPARAAICCGALTLLLLGGCHSTTPGQEAVMANPASVYCVESGGRLEIVEAAGGEQGMCHLADGTVVEEWEYFRRNHPQE